MYVTASYVFPIFFPPPYFVEEPSVLELPFLQRPYPLVFSIFCPTPTPGFGTPYVGTLFLFWVSRAVVVSCKSLYTWRDRVGDGGYAKVLPRSRYGKQRPMFLQAKPCRYVCTYPLVIFFADLRPNSVPRPFFCISLSRNPPPFLWNSQAVVVSFVIFLQVQPPEVNSLAICAPFTKGGGCVGFGEWVQIVFFGAPVPPM